MSTPHEPVAGLADDTRSVTLSERAATRISAILAKRPGTRAIRVSVEGGGCSGFSYKFDVAADTPEPDDTVIARNGAEVYIDPVSLDLLRGSEIDFTNDLIGAAFKITNPNAKAACGCGTSFSV
jgi:iron-sulfur cluster assembly accessory protein